MRIECENVNCVATYTIDDAQLSDTPIGAQCPYCGHVKLVQRGGTPNFPMSSVAGPFHPPPAAPSAPHSAPPSALGAAPALAPASTMAGLGSAPIVPPAVPPGSAPAGAGGPSYGVMTRSGDIVGHTGTPDLGGANNPFQSGTDNLIQRTGPLPAAPSYQGTASGAEGGMYGVQSEQPQFGGASLDLSLSDDFGPQGHGMPSNDLGVPGPMSAASSASVCQVCGVRLDDEFDKVIGLCDEHQRDRRYGEGDGVAPAPAMAAGVGAQWHSRSPDGLVAGPMTLEEMRARIRNGSIAATNEFSRDGIDFGPIHRFKELAYLASLTRDGQAYGPGPQFANTPFRPGIGRFLTPILLLLIVGGLGYLAYHERDQLVRLAEGLSASASGTSARGPNPLARYKAKWALAHPDVSGTPAEHLVTAKARHLEDTWRGYQQAEQAYQRAILLDDEDAKAIAGYVENLVVWKFALTSPEELDVAEQAARYAAQLQPESPDPHRALGTLAYHRGNLNGCRAGADAALQRDATDGRAKLLLAQCYLEGNVTLAIRDAERAQQLLPELRRADLVRGKAYAKDGRYASALQVLSERLKVDPRNAAAHRLYGRITQELGEIREARTHFERALRLEGDEQATLLAMAELALENGKPAEAIGYYRRVAGSEVYGRRGARVYTGWARAELDRRRGRRSVELARTALTFSNRDPAALLIRGEAALFVGSATTAALYAAQAESQRAGEPSILVLAGRAAAEQGDRDLALRKMNEAVTNDPQDPRLKGLLAGEYLKQNGYDRAFALMRKAADVDPRSVDSRRRSGLLSLSPVAVQDAIRQFRRSAIDERNASVAHSSIGLLHYHMGDRARAQASVERALRLDDANLTALIYKAQIALDRGDYRRARKIAQKVLAVERGSALGYLLLARSLAGLRRHDAAREHYLAALRSDPALLPAKVELAGLNLETEERGLAVQTLQDAYLINSGSLTVRRLMLKAGL